ncbi:hypothetical protein ACOME3_007706 [Neoechinorhynchus agilis]
MRESRHRKKLPKDSTSIYRAVLPYSYTSELTPFDSCSKKKRLQSTSSNCSRLSLIIDNVSPIRQFDNKVILRTYVCKVFKSERYPKKWTSYKMDIKTIVDFVLQILFLLIDSFRFVFIAISLVRSILFPCRFLLSCAAVLAQCSK